MDSDSEIDDKSLVVLKIEPLDSVPFESSSNTLADVENHEEIKIVSPEKLMLVQDNTNTAPNKPSRVSKPKSNKKNGKKKKSRLTEEIVIKNGEPLLSFYARRKLIPLLQSNFVLGDPELKSALTMKLNYSSNQADKVVEYIECQASQGEKNAEQDNTDESFGQITEWLKFLHYKNINDISGNEIPLLFKLIPTFEDLPTPNEIGDIKLAELYQFISKIMLGYPAQTPTGATGTFLHETFKSIINEMQSVSPDIEEFGEQLKQSNLITGENLADNFNLEELRLILSNSSTNPFNFSFEFLNSKHFENIFCNSEND